MTAPSAEDQVQFLSQLQRIFSEGQFVATYKYALLLSLAELSVEQGDDSGESLTLSTRDIAEKFIQYYWRQAAPYFPPGLEAASGTILSQNTGRQAALLRKLTAARARCSGSFGTLRRDRREWAGLLRETDEVIRQMPLWRLQTLGKAKLDFLYENRGKGTVIELRPGVAFCFRRFHGLVGDMVRGAWVRYVRRQNREALGTASDLGDFLFGSERSSLLKVQAVLEEAQKGSCFYCNSRLRGDSAHVDHFIPWSRYPLDLGHNFVLAHGSCNSAKGDLLASTEHLLAWSRRNVDQSRLLDEGFEKDGILHDLGTSARIAHWSYAQIARTGGQTWFRKEDLRLLEPRWEEPFMPLLKIKPALGL